MVWKRHVSGKPQSIRVLKNLFPEIFGLRSDLACRNLLVSCSFNVISKTGFLEYFYPMRDDDNLSSANKNYHRLVCSDSRK